MRRFYVATRFGEYREARRVIDKLRDLGHRVDVDWTRNHQFDEWGDLKLESAGKHLPLQEQQRFAYEECAGPMAADVILLWNKDMAGAYIEVGLALAKDRTVYVIGCRRFTIFWSLPNVIMFDTEEEFFQALHA